MTEAILQIFATIMAIALHCHIRLKDETMNERQVDRKGLLLITEKKKEILRN
jgi:hypothetical protein